MTTFCFGVYDSARPTEDSGRLYWKGYSWLGVPGHMRGDGGDRQSCLSHVPELDVSLVGSCQHSSPGSTPSHVGRSHLKGTVSRDGFGFWWHVWLVLGRNRGRDHYFNCWGAPMILLCREGILGRNWDKNLKTFAPCYSQSPPLTDFTHPYGFLQQQLKVGGAWLC
jgi:hypothetical protein